LKITLIKRNKKHEIKDIKFATVKLGGECGGGAKVECGGH